MKICICFFQLLVQSVIGVKQITRIEAIGKVTINIFDVKDYAIKRVNEGDDRSFDPESSLADSYTLKNEKNHSNILIRRTKKDKKTPDAFKQDITLISSKSIEDNLHLDKVINENEYLEARKSALASLLDPIRTDDNPVDTLSKLGLTSFVHMMEGYGSKHLYRESKNVTIFAPTNAAFRSMTREEQVMLLLQNKLTEFANYHICPGIYTVEELETNNILTFNSNYLSTTKIQNALSIQSANIVSGNIKSNNSVIHIIDKVLFYYKRTLMDLIDNDPRFQLFSYISRNTSVRSLLNSSFSYTLFLPKTSALLSSGVNLFTSDLKDRERFLRSHIYGPGVLYLNNFVKGTVYRLQMSTLEQKIIPARRIDENTLRMANSVLVKEGDIIARNGVIHLTEETLV